MIKMFVICDYRKENGQKKINSTIFWYELEKELYLVKKKPSYHHQQTTKTKYLEKNGVKFIISQRYPHIWTRHIFQKISLWQFLILSINTMWLRKKDAMMDCSKKNSIVTKSILIINFFCTKNKNLWVCVCCSYSLVETKNT